MASPDKTTCYKILTKERKSYYLNAYGCKSSKCTSYAEGMSVPVAARSKA